MPLPMSLGSHCVQGARAELTQDAFVNEERSIIIIIIEYLGGGRSKWVDETLGNVQG